MSDTPIADMIGEMLKNCIPLDTVMIAVRSMERAVSTRHPVDETAKKRRVWDREYQRRKRSCLPDIHPIPPDSTRHQVESALSSSSLLTLLDTSLEKKSSGIRARARGQKLPPDWKPKQHHYDEAAKLGMNRSQVDSCADRMRNWCDANSNRSVTTKANWDAAFMGAWLKESNQRSGNNGRRTVQDAARDLHEETLRRVRELDEPAPSGLCGPEGANPVRLLSSR